MWEASLVTEQDSVSKTWIRGWGVDSIGEVPAGQGSRPEFESPSTHVKKLDKVKQGCNLSICGQKQVDPGAC